MPAKDIAMLNPETAERLAKILGMLGSDHAGERSAASLAAHRLLKEATLNLARRHRRPLRLLRVIKNSIVAFYRKRLAKNGSFCLGSTRPPQFPGSGLRQVNAELA
jgi:hypothetical protein